MKLSVIICCMSVLFVPISVFAADTMPHISELKTFFTSSQQRSALDRSRSSGEFGSKSKNPSVKVKLRKPLNVQLNGVVYSETGKPVIWVNGNSTLKSDSIDESIRVKASALKKKTTKVPVKVNQQWLNMKPGQIWSESHNQVQENYQIKESK